jgi:hypothetical protein
MRVLLVWVLQLRACFAGTAVNWTALPVHQRTEDIDLPYKEVATELGGTVTAAPGPTSPKKTMSKSEAKMAASDAALLAMLGIED